MLREKTKKKIVAVIHRDGTKSEKSSRTPSPNKDCGAGVRYEVQVQFSPSADDAVPVKPSKGKWETIFKIPEKNQLHPNSIFADRRNSFSSYSTPAQQRRASYDRCPHTPVEEAVTPERRASYDVSYLKPVDPAQEHHKPSRRGSLVQRWFRRISDATDAHKKEGKHKTSTLSVHDAEQLGGNGSDSTKTKDNDSSHISGDNTSGVPGNTRHSQDDSIQAGYGNESATKKSGSGGAGGASPRLRNKRVSAIDPPRLTTEVPLIEPSQVSVSQETVLTAESVLTSNEILRRNCDSIDVLTRENLKIVADLLHVAKDEIETLNESVTEPSSLDKEPTELVRGAYKEVDQLTTLLNKCLCVTEEETIAAGCQVINSGGNSTSPSKQAQVASSNATSSTLAANAGSSSVRTLPSIPASKLQPITQRLREYLITLVTTWTEREEERERQRVELQRCREQLHAMHEEQQRRQRANESTPRPPTKESSPSVTSENKPDESAKPSPE